MMFCIYPSHVVSLTPENTSYLCISPKSADRLAIRSGRAIFDPKPTRQTIKAMSSNAVMMEDRAQIERLQTGMRSRYVERYSLGSPDLEGTVWDIYQYLARRLAPGEFGKARLKRAS